MKKILLIYWADANVSPATVYEHVQAIKKFSQHQIELCNVNDLAPSRWTAIFKRKHNIKLSHYDGIIIHNTLSYDPDNVYNIENFFDISIQQFSGKKIIFKQDEIVKTNRVKQLLADWQFDVLFTCVPQRDLETIYPHAELPRLKKVRFKTGYVTPEMRQYRFNQHDERAIDIFYRGMKLPFHFGRLSYEKYLIGEKFKEICAHHALISDISSEQQDRIYGDEWIQRLSRSKACLAVESGASIYDFNGDLAAKTAHYLQSHPDADFEQVHAKLLSVYDNQYIYNALSPRHFEAAATRTLLIMHEGEYEGVLQANKHYLAVKKDYSNIDAVITAFRDADLRYEITEAAFQDVINNPLFSYEQFVRELDTVI